ncbi:MAG: hypothetical protein IKD43_02175 [Clostridia bacterium]|nr:hypothetical protein [Clostridia bacterium]
MNTFFRERCFFILEKRRTLLLFGVLFLLGILLGILFIKTPTVYEYHLNLTARFLGEVCFSDRSVFLIFFERTCGNALLLALVLLAGVHFAGLAVPPVVLLYRAYAFGGSLTILFTVYRVTGVLVALTFYLPIHLLVDVILIGATAVSCNRAREFCFCRRDFCELGLDFFAFFMLIAAVCLFEAVLLFAIFHPIGAVV